MGTFSTKTLRKNGLQRLVYNRSLKNTDVGFQPCLGTHSPRNDSPLYSTKDHNPMMKEIDLKEITNARIASRIKQVLVLIAIILIGIVISIATQAQPPKHFKAKYACSK